MRKAKVFLMLAALAFLISGPAAGADVTVIQGQGPREFRRVIKTDEQGRLTGGIHVIDACEATTGWTALSNDTTGLDTDLDHVLGAKSLEWDKVDGAANTIFGGVQKTISSVDLSFLVENGGSFGYSLNVSATTDIAYCFLRLGTDASNYNEWRVADAGLAAGWNSLRFNADVPSSAGALGNGWNAAAVTYLALGCAFDLETSTLADLRVDHITAHVGLQVAADVNASVSSSSGASQVDVQKLGGNAIDLGAGAVGPGTQRVTNAIGDIFSVSDDDNANTATNPMFFLPTDGAAVNAVDHPVWHRLSQDGANAMSATYPVPVSPTMAASSVTNPFPFRLSVDGTNWLGAANPFPISKDLAANLTGNRIWMTSNTDQLEGFPINLGAGAAGTGTQRTIGATDGPGGSVATPGFFQLQDGGGTDLLQIETMSDGIASSKLGAYTNSRGMVYNGATWDGAVSTPTGEAAVQDTSTRPGEDASADLRWGGVKDHAIVEPNVQGPTVVDNAGGGVVGDIVFTSRKVLSDATWCVHIDNTGGGSGDVLSDAIVLISPTGDAGTWESMTWTVCDALTAVGGSCSFCSDLAFTYVQVEALCGAGDDTEVNAWYRARK